MLRGIIAVMLLSGCTVIDHVQVLPIVNTETYDVNCCVLYAEIPPSTRASLSVTKNVSGVKIKGSVKWRF